MVPLDRIIAGFCRLSIVSCYSICSGLTAILNAKLLFAASPKCAELPYRIVALIVAFDIAVSP